MLKNNRGITLFELLATISVAGIVLTLMTSIMFSTLFAKNQIEYINRLDDEVYDITSFLSGRFQRMGYGSILLYEGENLSENQLALIITNEFNPDSSEGDSITLSRDSFKSYIVLIDSGEGVSNGVYLHQLFPADEDNIENLPAGHPLEDFLELSFEDQIEFYTQNIDAFVSNYLPDDNARPLGKISSDNLIIHEASINLSCTKTYDMTNLNIRFGNISENNMVSNCSNAFVEIDLDVSYRLRSGEALDPRTYTSKLFF